MGKARILKFGGDKITDKDVYNPTAPFIDRGNKYIAARVESRDSEFDSEVFFFKEKEGVWHHDPDVPSFPLQDPFMTRIDSDLIFGGVRYPVNGNSWQTWFYRGRDLLRLKKITHGPLGMKDIRLVELHDGRIGVFTRPMGKIGGRGKIGFAIIDTLEHLDKFDWYKAELIKGLFLDDEWGGVNEAHLLKEGLIGVLGHFATFTVDESGENIKHYKSMVFTYDYFKMQSSPIKVLAVRSDFPKGDAKRSPELDDIVISGGLNFLENGRAELYVGLSDINCGQIEIDNPFTSL